jgi:general secretion pathway protein K
VFTTIWKQVKNIHLNPEDGFVLIAVIWFAGLLAVSATAFVATTTAQIFLARNVSEEMRLDGAASGVATLTAYNLSQPDAKISELSKWQTCAWNTDINVTWLVQDQGGLVDLNTANPDLLLALLTGLTKNPQLARKILTEVQDFKDPDQIAASGSAEPTLYNGKAYGPKNTPFETPFELDQIPDISDELFLALQNLVTVQSQQQGIDLTVAPDFLQALLKAGVRSGVDIQEFNVPSPARVYAIDAVAHRGGGGTYHRRAMVNLLRQPEKPFAMLEWRRSNTETAPKTEVKPSTPCFNARS